jgi:hypothetical protein
MRIFLAAVVFLGLQACGGTLGGTKPFTLEIDQPAGSPKYLVEVATVAVGSDANEVDSVGTLHLGRMDSGEVDDLRESLESTFAGITWPSADSAVDTLAVHVLVSHYYVAHSNNDGAILTCIDWALATRTNVVLFSEQFFASNQAADVEGLNTLGKLKNLLNAQVVRRVAEKSVRLAIDIETLPELDVPHTYATVAEAAAPLPTRLTSFLGLPSISTKGVGWTTNAPTEPVDWSQQLN